MTTLFDRDYYENGRVTGKSGWQDFHFIPERSYSEAMEIVERFDFKSVLDFGAAKGFLAHSLQTLGKTVYAEDLSEYARDNSYGCADVKPPFYYKNVFDLLICKDVMEHVAEESVKPLLEQLERRAYQFLFIIPLGDNDLMRIREYELDKTHVTKKNEDWWLEMFWNSGYRVKGFHYSMGAIKQAWTSNHPHGNGFFVLEGSRDNN